MNTHFIENITIENFKCFEHLEIEGIERVNLIGGKNNVGKTAFLEAVELLVSSNTGELLASNTAKMLIRRQVGNNRKDMDVDFIKKDDDPIKINANNKLCEIQLHEDQNLFGESDFLLSFIVTINGDENEVSRNGISLSINKLLKVIRFLAVSKNINFISSTKNTERDIAIFYGSLIDLDREDFLNNSLKIFDESIESIKLKPVENNNIFKLKLKDRQTLVLLSSLGEGLNRYIAILCAIWASKDGFLFIDEIENGIHYTNYKKLWQIIFQASADANCQLFITSHSKECIESFNEIQFEQEGDDGAYFEFYMNMKTNRITASKRDKEQLKYALTHQGRMRGE